MRAGPLKSAEYSKQVESPMGSGSSAGQRLPAHTEDRDQYPQVGMAPPLSVGGLARTTGGPERVYGE